MKRIFLATLAILFLLTACGTAEEGIEIHTPWTRPAAQGENEAIYFELHNHSSGTDELTGASSDIADVVEIHESKLEGDVMQMNMLSSLPIEAFADLEFAPGGLHIMLVSIKHELKVGDEVTVVLHFMDHEDITMQVPVQDVEPAHDED